MSRRSMATTLPDVFSSSSLPCTTKLAGATKPLIESRSCFRTITFLWVDDMGSDAFYFLACFLSLELASPQILGGGYVFADKSIRAIVPAWILALSGGIRRVCAFTVAKR